MNTEKKVYKLKKPVAWGEDTIHELEFKTPTIGDIKFMKLTDPTLDDILKLGSKLSGQPQKMIEALSIEDGMEVAEILGNFLGASRKTGQAQSEPS